jgi:hypothetical protein
VLELVGRVQTHCFSGPLASGVVQRNVCIVCGQMAAATFSTASDGWCRWRLGEVGHRGVSSRLAHSGATHIQEVEQRRDGDMYELQSHLLAIDASSANCHHPTAVSCDGDAGLW